MRVERSEVEFTGDQEDDRADGRQPAIAACFAFGGLKQPVQRFEEAVGHSAPCPGDDALQMTTDDTGNLFHGLDLRAHEVRAPLPEHVTDDVDLLAVEYLAQ